MNDQINIKRSPIVLIRTLVFIEFLGLVVFAIASQLDRYKYLIYSGLSLPNLLPYQSAKIIFLSGAQLVLTIYAFLNWYYESYTMRPGSISHQKGVFFKKDKTAPLQKTMSLTISSGPIGKMLHYGSIHIENSGSNNSITLSDVSRPEEQLKTIKRMVEGENRFNEKPDLARLLSEDEHDKLEFKSSLRFDYKTQSVNHNLEKATMKTIAAFLNSKGGHLVIGVDNSREPLGLENDYKTLKRQNSDGFENHFTQVFNKMIGPEFRDLVRLNFQKTKNADTCVAQVAQSPRPVYLKLDDNEQFYVRTGNTTTPLKLSEVESYSRSRFHRS